ncbi:MAG TPA: ribosome recycling factor [Gemmatimonadaceae bacterium]|nr:ribosome recycling factor [Gemmatimonadaceae bacterium]
MDIQTIIKESRVHMDKAIESTKRELTGIRSGKASPGMLDTVKVDMYGTTMSLNQVAAVSAPEPRLILVTPFDRSQAKVIEKAIRDAELGLDPAHQGNVIRVPLPSMNEERRKDLVKVVHKLAEEGRIAIRHSRTEGREKLKKLSGVSEDDVKHAEKDLQKIHDDFLHKIDGLVAAKETEIMEV